MARGLAQADYPLPVAIQDPSEALKELDATLTSVEKVLDIPSMREEVTSLEAEASAPDLWDDQAKAQAVTSRLSFVQGEISKVTTLRSRVDDLAVMFELAAEMDDEDALAEAEAELAKLHKSIGELEVRTLLSGEYDQREAIVTIRSEAGGVDAADFAEMLLRMYTRYCERHNYPYEVLDTSYAEEAGIKSATFAVKAPYAYGTLSVEQGTHRLVRISPFDANARRHTSFASVYVSPEIDDSIDIDIKPDDIRTDTYRSGGKGGQHVNTTDSAVRLTHIPTGIVVACQNERSQHKNKEKAMSILRSRLYEHELEKKKEATKHIEDSKLDIDFGSQIRSYVLQPYRMVKDLRTREEIGDVDRVLDGDLNQLIRAYLLARRNEQR